MRIRIKKLHPARQLPEYAHGPPEDAGMDIRCLENARTRTRHPAGRPHRLGARNSHRLRSADPAAQWLGFEACDHASERAGDYRPGLSRRIEGHSAESGHSAITRSMRETGLRRWWWRDTKRSNGRKAIGGFGARSGRIRFVGPLSQLLTDFRFVSQLARQRLCLARRTCCRPFCSRERRRARKAARR